MPEEPPHIKLFTVRCTLLAFHALIWSFLKQSKPEFLNTSIRDMSEDSITRHLNAVVIVGYVFIGLNFVLTMTCGSLHSIPLHFLHIVAHSIAILLVIISILNYWNVKLLWIPTSICCIFPTFIELIYVIVVFIRVSSSSKKRSN